MLKRKTVIVVGAGCSAEYKFDVGAGLRRTIAAKILAEDPTLIECAYHLPGGSNNLKRRLTHFAVGLQSHETIDQYLDFIKDDTFGVSVGKLAIARCILEQEDGSGLRSDQLKTGMGGVDHTWMPSLISRILRDLGRPNLAQAFQNLTFVCFNYDRVIEQIAYHQLLNATADQKEALQALASLEVLHPYGSLGQLRWQGGPDVVEFAANATDGYHVRQSAQFVRTFTETVDSAVGLRIRESIDAAEQICFIGFGYVRQNMSLLRREQPMPPVRVWANQYGMPPPEQVLSRSLVADTLFRKHPIQTGTIIQTNLTASDFFHHWAGTLFT